MCIFKVRDQHLGSALLCGQEVGAMFLRVLFWQKCLTRGLPLSYQTLSLKLIAGGKKGTDSCLPCTGWLA